MDQTSSSIAKVPEHLEQAHWVVESLQETIHQQLLDQFSGEMGDSLAKVNNWTKFYSTLAHSHRMVTSSSYGMAQCVGRKIL